MAGSRLRIVALVVTAGIAAALVLSARRHVTIESLVQHEAYFRNQLQSAPLAVLSIAFVVYVAVTGTSLPIATGLTLVYAWFFGFWPALVLVSFASTAGATLAFLASRYLFRDWVAARFGSRLAKVDEAFARDGAFYLFTLRLLIVVPFWLVNLLMGLTPISVRTFWWVTQIGMLPATVIYVWTGASLPSIEQVAREGVASVLDWRLMLGLAALGLFPWLARAMVRCRVKRVEGRG